MALLHVAAVLAAVLALLLTVPWETGLVYEFQPPPPPLNPPGPVDTPAYTRQVVHFTSHGTRCEAWLYLPKGAGQQPPVVIMAHGLGGQKDMSLPAYAESFASSGMAVFLFDYRNFGGSDGEPRHWASPKRHVDDWFASYTYVKSTGIGGKVDTSRIALWGTSFAGGHVLVLASRLGTNVTAVVSQMPHLSGAHAAKQRLLKKGLPSVLRLLASGIHDRLRSLLGQAPAYVRLTGLNGELALMELSATELEKYISRRRQGEDKWQPMVLARILTEMASYNPVSVVHRIQAPVMLVAADRDHICPPNLVEEAAAKLGDKATLVRRDTTHFAIYHGEHLEHVTARMVTFLSGHFNNRAGNAPKAAAAGTKAVDTAASSAGSNSGEAKELPRAASDVTDEATSGGSEL